MQRKYSSSVRVFYPELSLEEVVKRIREVAFLFKEELGLKKVVLFGSYAKRRYTVASDIDILVVYDEESNDQDNVYKTLMKNLKLPRVELHLLSKKDYELMRESRWIKTVEEEGIEILSS